jgi:hypothetical protein
MRSYIGVCPNCSARVATTRDDTFACDWDEQACDACGAQAEVHVEINDLDIDEDLVS